jgi:hypothetical protein
LLFSWHFSLNNGTLTSEQRERERERGNGNEASPSPAPSSIIAHWLVGSGRSNAVSALCNNNDIGRTYQNTREYYHAFAKRERTGARIKSEKISREKEKEQTREEKTERKKREEEEESTKEDDTPTSK